MTEIPNGTVNPKENPSAKQEPSFVRIQRPQENKVGALKKLLQILHLVKRPLIEAKPPIATESEGRATIDREQLKQKLQQEPNSA